MKIIVVKDYEAMSELGAQIIKEQIQVNPSCTLGLATGSSPIGTYKNLIKANKDGEISFKDVKTYNLDEYCGISRSHPQSYYYFMHENLFDHVDINELPEFKGESPSSEMIARFIYHRYIKIYVSILNIHLLYYSNTSLYILQVNYLYMYNHIFVVI